MQKPIASIAHRAPRRLRLNVASRRGDRSFFDRFTQALEKESAVDGVSANPLTGSIIVSHSDGLDPMQLLARVYDLVELRQDEPSARSRKDSELETNALSVWALGLSGLAAVQAAQGQFIGHATENFWNAYGSQRLLNNEPLALGFAALGVYQLLAGNVLGSASSLVFYALVIRRIAETEGARARADERSKAHRQIAAGPMAP